MKERVFAASQTQLNYPRVSQRWLSAGENWIFHLRGSLCSTSFLCVLRDVKAESTLNLYRGQLVAWYLAEASAQRRSHVKAHIDLSRTLLTWQLLHWWEERELRVLYLSSPADTPKVSALVWCNCDSSPGIQKDSRLLLLSTLLPSVLYPWIRICSPLVHTKSWRQSQCDQLLQNVTAVISGKSCLECHWLKLCKTSRGEVFLTFSQCTLLEISWKIH